MSIQPAPPVSAPPGYIDALVRERYEWAMASDPNSDAVSRVIAYARWIAAAKCVERFRPPWVMRRFGRQPVALVLEAECPREVSAWELLAAIQPSVRVGCDDPVAE
jgi:hypothetical protein